MSYFNIWWWVHNWRLLCVVLVSKQYTILKKTGSFIFSLHYIRCRNTAAFPCSKMEPKVTSLNMRLVYSANEKQSLERGTLVELWNTKHGFRWRGPFGEQSSAWKTAKNQRAQRWDCRFAAVVHLYFTTAVVCQPFFGISPLKHFVKVEVVYRRNAFAETSSYLMITYNNNCFFQLTNLNLQQKKTHYGRILERQS